MDSLTIDSFELARSGRQIAGEIAIATLPRLVDLLAAPDGALHYQINGVINDDGSPGAKLQLTGTLRLICQRCNTPLDFELDRAVGFRFVGSEEELNALPIDDDEIDAVVGSRAMSVADWVEDEAMLSLPLVPRHVGCLMPSGSSHTTDAVATPNPFAALSALRSGSGARNGTANDDGDGSGK
ncbi:MAG: DUF177 domain-containing protein [Burkholderiaceae bacterium]|nr:DUF177 domain-containing protein [Burkholderiaceae bacterium]